MVRGMSVRRTWLAVAIVGQLMLTGAPAGAQGLSAAPSSVVMVPVSLDPGTGVVTADAPEPWPRASGTKGPGVSLAAPIAVGFDGHEFTDLPASIPAGSRITITATGPDGVIVELLLRNDGVSIPWAEIIASPLLQPTRITVPVQPIFAAAGQAAEVALPFDTPGSYLLVGYTVPQADANGDRPYPSFGCAEVAVTGPGTSPGPIPTPAATTGPPLCVPSPVPPELTPSPGLSRDPAADPRAVLERYIAALLAGDCAAARSYAAATFRFGNGELCGHLTVTAASIDPEGPATPNDHEVVYSATITTVGGDASMPDGTMTWFYQLLRQPDGRWLIAGGGSGP